MEAKDKAEPEVIIDWGPLDTSNCTQVWLVKVPRVVADLWDAQQEGVTLGHISINGPAGTSGNSMVTAHLNTFGEPLPNNWDMPFDSNAGKLKIISDDVAGNPSFNFTSPVVRKYEVGRRGSLQNGTET